MINYLYGAYIRHLERERLKTKIQRDNERLCNMISPRPSDPIEAFFEDRDRYYSRKQHPSMDREELDVDD